VSVQDAQTTQSLLKLADLARDATSYGNNVRVDGIHRVQLREVTRGHVAEDLALEREGDLIFSLANKFMRVSTHLAEPGRYPR
jgi:hypothetical protein